jgi:hypothetical protein
LANRATDAEREAVVAALRHHLADDRLTLDEYADRVEDAWAADTRETLDHVLHDLPLSPPRVVESRGRRHGEATLPRLTWRPTKERFRDPTTNRVMRVWVDMIDGTRHYVAEVPS